MSPQRIQLRRTKGWRKPEGAVVVSRPSRWGNPFRVGDPIRDPGYSGNPAHPVQSLYPIGHVAADGSWRIRAVRDAADAVALFRVYVAFFDDEWIPEVIRRDLGGRDLACWCKPGQPCHADVLLEIANGPAS